MVRNGPVPWPLWQRFCRTGILLSPPSGPGENTCLEPFGFPALVWPNLSSGFLARAFQFFISVSIRLGFSREPLMSELRKGPSRKAIGSGLPKAYVAHSAWLLMSCWLAKNSSKAYRLLRPSPVELEAGEDGGEARRFRWAR